MPSDDLAPGVHTAMRRDDLLQLASEADVAVGIVRQREQLLREAGGDAGIFTVALDHYLAETRSPQWAIRAQAWSYAATLVSFCALLPEPERLNCEFEPADMFAFAAAQLRDGETDLDHDLALGVFNTYRRARNLRMGGRLAEALALVEVPLDSLFGTGAEPHWGLYMYEYGLCLIGSGRAHEVPAAIDERAALWDAKGGRSRSTRHRLDFAAALALWASGDGTAATERLRIARERTLTPDLDQVTAAEFARMRLNHEAAEIQHLSLVQTLAECLGAGSAGATEATELAGLALGLAERVRGRWRVIARSQTPLATAFRRIYGDIALLASRIPGRAAAELGLQTALSAKQTGFAALLRRQRLLMSPHVASLLDEVTEVEDPPVDSLLVGGEENAGERLHRLRGRIVQDTSLMLAETVFPRPVPVREIREKLGDRYALDFVALPDTYDGTRSNWFRSVIAPGGGVVLFERFEPGPAFESFYGGSEPWVDHLPDLTRGHGPDWTALAREVLPHAVLDLVRAATRETPIQLLISAHSELSLLPWPALRIDDHGTRLVERAVLTHSPVLTCLSFTEPPTVEPPGLVCLAPWSGRNRPLKLAGELAVWDLPGSPDDRVLALCDWSDGTATVLGGDLPAVLRAGGSRAGLLHIACHGTGTGLAQSLLLPGPLPAARALSLEWPASVLMASCHVGRLHNPGDAEPLSFVMALLTGGSRCVVASIDSLRDLPAGRAATDVVSSVRDGPARLDVALRDYQLAAAGGVAANLNWALLNTYVR